MKHALATFAVCAVLPALARPAQAGPPPDLVGEAAGDQYGRVVASVGDVSGDDIPDFAISAPFHSEGGLTNRGKVYVYSGATFHLLGDPLLGQHAGDQFGFSIASANLTGDARRELIVGAPLCDNNTLTDAGRVYVYSFSGGLWTLRGTTPGLFKGEQFGWSLADGIHLLDGPFDKFVVGAPLNSLAGGKAGRVVVYSFSSMGISQFRQILGQKAGDRFGYALARIGKANPDSLDEFVVGAPFNDDTGADAGKTYVYSGNAVVMPGMPAPMFVRRGANPGDQFGRAVAGVGDVNGDGRQDYAVGAPLFDSTAADAGRVYVISGANNSTLWARSGAVAGERQGSSIAGGLDFTGDGRADVVVGAFLNSTAGVNAGAFYLRSGIDGLLIEPATLGASPGDLFGYSVAMLPSLDGDDAPELLIGSPGFDVGPAVDVGRADLFLSTTPLANSASQPDNAGDATGDGPERTDDVLAVLGAWGPCATENCPADVNLDGIVDIDDLLAVIASIESE